MPDSKVQFTTHGCATDDRPFLISSSLQFPPSHTKEHPQVGPSVKDYHQPQQQQHRPHPHHHGHRNSPLALHYHQPHSRQLEIYDPNFQVSATHGPGLLPMPVAYEGVCLRRPLSMLPPIHTSLVKDAFWCVLTKLDLQITRRRGTDPISMLPFPSPNLPCALEPHPSVSIIADFQYPLPNFELPDQQVASSVTRSTGLQQSNPGLLYQTYPNGPGSYGPNGNLPLMPSTGWDLTPVNRNQIASSSLPQDLLLPNFFNEPVQYESNHSSSALHPVLSSAPLESISRGSHHLNPDHHHHMHDPTPPHLSENSQMNCPLPNPPTPPPLFDATEQDLLSSFLNIFGDSHGECDFDPQGMPEGMPVLGELKRRLEEDRHGGSLQYGAKRDADDVGRQVEARLKISDPEAIYPHPRRPSLKSFHTTSGSLSSSSDSHFYQDQNFPSRKKAKTTNLMNSFDAHPSHLVEPPHEHCVDLEGDTKMASWECHPSCEPEDWPGTTISHSIEASHSDRPHLSQLSKPFKPSFSQSAPLSPVSQPRSFQRMKNNSVASFGADASHNPAEVFENQASCNNPPPPTTTRRGSKSATKPPKSTHILSEQRRRNAIQGGFGSLVEILRAGEAMSGISIAVGETSNAQNNNENNSGSTNTATGTTTTTTGSNSKPKTTRGRGRRGEIETGASKSVVLEKAAEFVQWMTDGNSALKNEVQRVENILKNHGVEV